MIELVYAEQFPVAWVGLLFVGILKFNLTFIPIGELPVCLLHRHSRSRVQLQSFSRSCLTLPTLLASPVRVHVHCHVHHGLTLACVDADRDAKKRWATGIASQSFGFGGIGSSLVSGLGKAALGKVIG